MNSTFKPHVVARNKYFALGHISPDLYVIGNTEKRVGFITSQDKDVMVESGVMDGMTDDEILAFLEICGDARKVFSLDS